MLQENIVPYVGPLIGKLAHKLTLVSKVGSTGTISGLSLSLLSFFKVIPVSLPSLQVSFLVCFFAAVLYNVKGSNLFIFLSRFSESQQASV